MTTTPNYGDILSPDEYELVSIQPKDMKVGDLFYDEPVGGEPKGKREWIANPLLAVNEVNEHVTSLTYRDMRYAFWGENTPRITTSWVSINPLTKIYQRNEGESKK